MAEENDKQKTRWHAMEANDVLKDLDVTAENGLDEEKVKERLDKYGKNELPKGKKRSWWKRLLMQFHNVLIYVLLASAVITGLMEHYIDMWVILAVVIINALIGYIQEGKAERALESIREMLSLDAEVIRNGEKKTIDAEELVPGDVVFLKSGNKIPADIRLINTKDLRVEES
ncbi:MAG: cation-transporting P-type ATPase, partial [Bacteroidota bacterium]